MKHLQLAFELYGQKEILGIKDNPVILDLFNEIGYDGNKLKDETAWCAAFVNAILKRSGKAHSGKLNARSLLIIGSPVSVPKLGDVVVLWRESKTSWKGHTGFYINHDEKYIYILGGNQNNQINITAYPINRLLGYRRI